ncbi:hypothetical protein D3C84_1060200 [compost metagenome]
MRDNPTFYVERYMQYNTDELPNDEKPGLLHQAGHLLKRYYSTAAATAASATGYTLTFLRLRPQRSNLTTPSTNANSVSSLPMPTLLPG